MSTFKGTLVVAGIVAAASFGCQHYRQKTYPTPPSTTEVTTPPSTTPISPEARPEQPGTETGTGGAGQYTGGFPQSTPSTTTPRQSSTGISGQNHDTNIPSEPSTEQGLPSTVTQPGTGGSGVDTSKPGMDVKNPDMNPENCNRNQIGSPNSSDVICDPNLNPGTGGSGLTKPEMDQSSDLSSSPGSSTSSEDLKSSTGTGGAGLDEGTTTTTTETKKTVKHKKHKKDTSGTGGSGVTESKTKTKEIKKEEKKDTSKDTEKLDEQHKEMLP